MSDFTQAQEKLLVALLGNGKYPVSGIVYVGIGSPQDRVGEDLENLGIVSRQPLKKQGLTRITGSWVKGKV